MIRRRKGDDSMATTQESLSAYVSTEEIAVTGLNPRQDFDEEGLRELASSIGSYGVIEPLVVRKAPGEGYQLVAGERRLKAARMAGLEQVPVVVRELNDTQVREVMLLENLQRQDLRPLEEASALATLVELGMTREELADRIGMSHSWVAGRIRLLKLPDDIKRYLDKDRIGVEQAMAYVPYVEWPVIDAMVKDLREKFEGDSYGYGYHEDLSVHDVKHMIDLQLRNGRHAQDLDHFGWMDGAKELQREFHKDGECKDCKVPIEYGDVKRLCLNTKCFRKKVRAAKKRIKERKQREVEKLAKKGEVDLSKLRHNEYELLQKGQWNSPKFDMKGCNGCESRRTGTDAWDRKSTVCVNPSCWNSKQKAAEAERNRQREEARLLLLYNARLVTEGALEDLEARLLRFVLEANFDGSKGDVDALQQWVKRKPKGGWKKALEKIPAEDVPKAILLMVVNHLARRLEYDENAIKESPLARIFPELFEGELPEGLQEPKEEDEELHCAGEVSVHELQVNPYGIPDCPDVELSPVNGLRYCGKADAEAYCIRIPESVNSTFECPRGYTRTFPGAQEPDDVLEACEKRGGEAEGELCDPGAFPECNGCEVYGVVEGDADAEEEEVA